MIRTKIHILFSAALLLMALFAGIYPTEAQDTQEHYQREAAPVHRFNKSKWEKLRSKTDYREKARKERTPGSFSLPNLSFAGPVFRFILFALLLGILGFLIYKLLSNYLFTGNKKVREKKSYRIEDLEEHLEEIDLDAFLQQALKEQQYKLALRIYYLMIMKELAARKFIKWKKEKTNATYLTEMRQHEQYAPFKALTFHFEQVWYGDLSVQESLFTTLQPKFTSLLAVIKAYPEEQQTIDR